MAVTRTDIKVGVHAEGPHWDSRTQSLLHVDITEGDIYRWNSITGESHRDHLEGRVGFAVPCRSGGYIAGLNRRLVHVEPESKTVTTIGAADLEPGTTNRFNDGKCDASGRLWAGTMDDADHPTQLKEEAGFLYSLERNRTVNTRLDKVSISNGLAWTADQRVMFFIDSIPRKVFAYDFDIHSGNIGNKRVVVDFGDASTLSTLGYPDGMTIDCEEKLWVACYSGAKVIRFDPETGKQLQVVNIPDSPNVTSCCFGGPNLDNLYVTTSRYAVTQEFMQKYPGAGSIYKVTGLGVRGLHEAYSFDG